AGALGPGHGRVKIRHHLGVRNFGNDFREDLAEILDLRHIALPGVELGADGEITDLGKPAADVPDMFVQPEDLLDDEHRRERPPEAGIARYAGTVPSATGILTSPASSPSVSVLMVVSAIGCVASANPVANDVITKPRRERSMPDVDFVGSSCIGCLRCWAGQ